MSNITKVKKHLYGAMRYRGNILARWPLRLGQKPLDITMAWLLCAWESGTYTVCRGGSGGQDLCSHII